MRNGLNGLVGAVTAQLSEFHPKTLAISEKTTLQHIPYPHRVSCP